MNLARPSSIGSVFELTDVPHFGATVLFGDSKTKEPDSIGSIHDVFSSASLSSVFFSKGC